MVNLSRVKARETGNGLDELGSSERATSAA
jgi:hypothetical protein